MTSTSYIDLTIDNFDVQLPHEGQEKHGVDDDISQPNSKRAKVEHGTESVAAAEEAAENGLDDVDNDEDAEDNCSICLHRVEDRTVIPNCSHEFCFECLLVWIGQSRRCPLCNQPVGDYVIHSIRSRHDYRKHHLTPLNRSPIPQQGRRTALDNVRQRAARQRRERRRNHHDTMDEADRLERSILQRRWIYEHDLYAKHVGSNRYTKYRPYPTPSQFAASADLIARTTTFLRRELRVWEGLDVEFLTNLIISLMKSIDIRSESAVKLLAEFLDMGSPEAAKGKHINSEHFAHEVYCYVRSPYKDLFVYDTIVQYDTPAGIQPPSEITRRRRWDQQSDPHSPSPPPPNSQAREGPSRGRESNVSHTVDPESSNPTHYQRDHPAHPQTTQLAVASSSRNTLDASPRRSVDAPPSYRNQRSTVPSSSRAPVEKATHMGSNMQVSELVSSHSRSHQIDGVPGHNLNRKGKGRDMSPSPEEAGVTRGGVSRVDQVHPVQDRSGERRAGTTLARHDGMDTGQQGHSGHPTTSTARPRLGRDLKSSIRSHLGQPPGTPGPRQDVGSGDPPRPAIGKGK